MPVMLVPVGRMSTIGDRLTSAWKLCEENLWKLSEYQIGSRGSTSLDLPLLVSGDMDYARLLRSIVHRHT